MTALNTTGLNNFENFSNLVTNHLNQWFSLPVVTDVKCKYMIVTGKKEKPSIICDLDIGRVDCCQANCE